MLDSLAQTVMIGCALLRILHAPPVSDDDMIDSSQIQDPAGGSVQASELPRSLYPSDLPRSPMATVESSKESFNSSASTAVSASLRNSVQYFEILGGWDFEGRIQKHLCRDEQSVTASEGVLVQFQQGGFRSLIRTSEPLRASDR